MTNNHHSPTLLLYGGNGYVGSRVLELASKQGAHCISVSRSGSAPAHLLAAKPPWLEGIQWIAGDAAEPDTALIALADVVICLVGSPPLPTFSQSAFDQQLLMNGNCNSVPICAAQAKGVSRVVLMSAHIPALLNSDKFAYYKGKEQAMDAARFYASASANNSVTVLRPSAIYGTRHTRAGTSIPLALLMGPVAWLMKRLPATLIRLLPESPVSLEIVAQAIVTAALHVKRPGLNVIENQQLLGR
jgi:nucleoside-diphosphate-sugar epimerase